MEGTSVTIRGLAASVTHELVRDPRIEDTESVAVSADDDVVTLRGRAHSVRREREAKRAGERVRGALSRSVRVGPGVIERDPWSRHEGQNPRSDGPPLVCRRVPGLTLTGPRG
jgi:hypothetical protein